MKLPLISPTQISTWRSCKRKFAFTYLGTEPRPESTKAQRIGVAVHGRVERFFQTGVPDYGGTLESPEEAEGARLLAQVVGYLPLGAQSEQKVEAELGGVLFGGRFDWLHLNHYDESGMADGAELGDLKTTSNLRWAKSRQELELDPQALVYTYGQNLVPPDRVECRWVYVQTRGRPDVREVRFKADPSALDPLIVDGRQIVQAWEAKIMHGTLDPNTFEPKTSTCDAFGGCPFRAKCKLDPAERLASLTSRMGLLSNQGTGDQAMGQMTFEEMMAAANGIGDESAVNPPVVAAAPPPAPAANPVDYQRLGAPPPAAAGVSSVLRTEQKETTPAPEKAKRVRTKRDTDPAPALAQVQPIGTLFLSCLPIGQAFEGLEHVEYIVAAARAEISAKMGVEDYRLVDFGKGAGVLVATVEEKIKAIRPRALYVDARSPEGRILAGPLMALADQTYQGV